MLRRIEFTCASLLLVAVVVLVGIASVARAVGSPIIWSVEMAQLLFLWLCIFAIDIAMQEDRHFGLEVLLFIVPPPVRKMIEIINLLVLTGLLVFLMQYAWKNMMLMHPRLVGALQMPGSYFHASLVVGFALLIRTLLAKLVKRIQAKAES